MDETDCNILSAREAKWHARPGPRVGDFVIMPDGNTRRFTHDWGGGIQTTCGISGEGSFHFDRDGHMDYSGGLDPQIPKSNLIETDEVRPGRIWFFHHDMMRAHNGVYADVLCRVYQCK